MTLRRRLLVLTAFMIGCFLMISGQASAGEYDNKYALTVTTGVKNGDQIGMFIVTYVDENGVTRKQYIQPQDGDYVNSLNYAKGKGYDSKAVSQIKNLGYTVNAIDNISKLKPLQSYSCDTYLVDFYFKVKTLVRIDAVTSIKEAKNAAWTVTDMRFYKVNEVYGLGLSGMASDKPYIKFKGSMLGKLEFNNTSHLRTLSTDNSNDKIFQFGASYVDGCRLNTSAKEEYDNSKNYYNTIFSMEIADRYGAGIEAFTNNSGTELKNLKLPEVMVLSAQYFDTYGAVRIVNMPVMLNVQAAAIIQGQGSAKFVDIAGQGETIGFYAILPDFASFPDKGGISLTYGFGNDIVEMCNLTKSNVSTHDAIFKKLKESDVDGDKDLVQLVNTTVYITPNTSNIKYGTDSNKTMLTFSVPTNSKEIHYYPADTDRGYEIGSISTGDKAFTRELKKGNKAFSIGLSDNQRYLIVIGTHNTNEGATMADISFSLNYMSIMGTNSATETISLRDAANDFYGLWPDTNGNNISYEASVSKGANAYAIIEVEDVAYFTGIKLDIDETLLDNWQLDSLTIYEINTSDSIGSRKALWKDSTYGKYKSKIFYYRDVNGVKLSIMDMFEAEDRNAPNNIYNRTKMQVLLSEQNPARTIDFKTNTVINEDKYDWVTDSYYSMSYEQAQQNILFGKKMESYEITVHVPEDKALSGPNGDTGSSNYFYFQLEFTNGWSGYVQANQQLSSDRFRAGAYEKFTISTNRNYGELVAINIIPDQSTTEADPYDKLMIDTIEVRSKKVTGIDYTYVFDINDWIGIDYVEPAEKDKSSAPVTHSAEEVKRTFRNPRSARSAALLFTVGTGQISAGKQFSGQVSAKITYKDKTENTLYTTIDMVQYMYDFNSKPYKLVNDEVVSDPSTMFRAGHFDRFIVTINDIAELSSVELFARTVDGEATWNIQSMAVQFITDDQGRAINDEEEYILVGETLTVAETTDSLPDSMNCVKASDTTKKIIFNADMRGMMTEDDTEMPFSIQRVPDTINDTINLYVVADKGSRDLSSMIVNGKVTYRTSTGDSVPISQKLRYATMTVGSDSRQVFYYKGLSAVRLESVASVYVKSQSKDGSDDSLTVDYIVLQHIRSGTVINTYYIPVELDIEWGYSEKMTGYFADSKEKQSVYIQCGEGSSKGSLTPELYDVAVSLQYKTKFDPTGAVYESPYIFITDTGWDKISNEKMMTFDFNEQYVKEITGIRVAGLGGLSVNVNRAAIGQYSGSGDLEEWYSITEGLLVNGRSLPVSVTGTEKQSSDEVIPVELTFTTATADEFSNPGLNGKMSMRINYVNYANEQKNYIITDVSNALKVTKNEEGKFVSGGFGEGESATVEFLLLDAKKISSVTLHPYDTDDENTVTWALKRLDAKYGEELGKVKTANIVVNEILDESKLSTFSLVDVILNITAYSSLDDTSVFKTGSNTEPGTIVMENYGTVDFKVDVKNSTLGYYCEVWKVVDGVETTKIEDCITFTDDYHGTFTPVVIAGTASTYRIKFIANENERNVAVLNVLLPAMPLRITASATDDPGNSVVASSDSLEAASLTLASNGYADLELNMRLKDCDINVYRLESNGTQSQLGTPLYIKEVEANKCRLLSARSTMGSGTVYIVKVTVKDNAEISASVRVTVPPVRLNLTATSVSNPSNMVKSRVSEAGQITITSDDKVKIQAFFDYNNMEVTFGDLEYEVEGASNCITKMDDRTAVFTVPNKNFTGSQVVYKVKVYHRWNQYRDIKNETVLNIAVESDGVPEIKVEASAELTPNTKVSCNSFNDKEEMEANGRFTLNRLTATYPEKINFTLTNTADNDVEYEFDIRGTKEGDGVSWINPNNITMTDSTHGVFTMPWKNYNSIEYLYSIKAWIKGAPDNYVMFTVASQPMPKPTVHLKGVVTGMSNDSKTSNGGEPVQLNMYYGDTAAITVSVDNSEPDEWVVEVYRAGSKNHSYWTVYDEKIDKDDFITDITSTGFTFKTPNGQTDSVCYGIKVYSTRDTSVAAGFKTWVSVYVPPKPTPYINLYDKYQGNNLWYAGYYDSSITTKEITGNSFAIYAAAGNGYKDTVYKLTRESDNADFSDCYTSMNDSDWGKFVLPDAADGEIYLLEVYSESYPEIKASIKVKIKMS